MKAVPDFLFLGFTVAADRDCSRDSKRHLLLERKAVTNLDIIFRSRDISLPAKVCIIKAVVFPEVMCRRESGSGRRLSTKELMPLNCGVGEDS